MKPKGHSHKFKKTIMFPILAVVLCLSVAVAAGFSGATEPETLVKKSLYALQYEQYLTADWYKIEKLNCNLTRKDAGYLLVDLYAKLTGSAVETIDYQSKITDTTEVALRRAHDLGFLSLNAQRQILPDKTVTQEEFSVMLVKVAQQINIYQASNRALTYTDQSKIQAWAKSSVQYLTDKRVYGYMNTKLFEPKKVMTVQRALSMVEKFMLAAGYTGEYQSAAFTRTLNGFKVPSIETAIMDFYSDKANGLNILFTGVMPFGSTADHKSALCQIAEVLDSNDAIGTNAVHAALEAIVAGYDPDSRTFYYENAQYIDVKTGRLTESMPSGAHIKLDSGNLLKVTYVK